MGGEGWRKGVVTESIWSNIWAAVGVKVAILGKSAFLEICFDKCLQTDVSEFYKASLDTVWTSFNKGNITGRKFHNLREKLFSQTAFYDD